MKHLLRSALPFFLLVAVGACGTGETQQPPVQQASLPTVTVYKSPTCGCCSKWVAHLEENGFDVKTVETADVSQVKVQQGVPQNLAACHTALVDGYVVEGHVPADVVKKMLEERPDIAGITLPGMPVGSPGMEVEGATPDHYDVLAFQKDGSTAVYARR